MWMYEIHLKRAYKAALCEDGVRILVERLWPRGITKEAAALDHCLRDLAPSPDLGKWYGHHSTKWPEFQDR